MCLKKLLILFSKAEACSFGSILPRQESVIKMIKTTDVSFFSLLVIWQTYILVIVKSKRDNHWSFCAISRHRREPRYFRIIMVIADDPLLMKRKKEGCLGKQVFYEKERALIYFSLSVYHDMTKYVHILFIHFNLFSPLKSR